MTNAVLLTETNTQRQMIDVPGSKEVNSLSHVWCGTVCRSEEGFATITREVSEGNIQEVCCKLGSLGDDVLRAKAETENVRKRLGSEVEKARQFAAENTMAELLVVLDSLEAVLADVACDPKTKEGVGLTRRQLVAILEKNGIVAVESHNQKFNPAVHQAVSVVSAEYEGIVVSVLQKGYTMKGRLLRPALVVVSKKGAN